MELEMYLNNIYNNSFSLFDISKDKKISSNLDILYVPAIEQIGDKMFYRNDETLISADGPLLIKFIYISQKGVIQSNRENTYTQIPSNKKGFLIRLSLPKNRILPENLSLDYFVDISKIHYRIDTIYDIVDNQMVKNNKIHFVNINPLDYPSIEFDKMFIDFYNHQKKIIDNYF